MKNPRRFFLFLILSDVVGFIAAFLLVIGLPFLFLRSLIKEQSIQEKGETAQAKLLEFWDTGTTINDNPQVGMLLEVRRLGGAPYQV